MRAQAPKKSELQFQLASCKAHASRATLLAISLISAYEDPILTSGGLRSPTRRTPASPQRRSRRGKTRQRLQAAQRSQRCFGSPRGARGVPSDPKKMPRPRRRRRQWALLALLPTIHASLPPLPKDQPPQQIKSDTADLTVLQDDGVEVFDSVDIDDMGRGLYPALPFAETSADDTAVTIYRPRKDAQVPTNWTVDALEELVTRTPFLSAEGTVVFTATAVRCRAMRPIARRASSRCAR